MNTVPWQGRAMPRGLEPAHFETAALRLGCEVAAIRAVWEVEASGRHFLPDGSVIRRFEPHHFPRTLWDRIGFAPRPGQAPWRASAAVHKQGRGEEMFRRAAALDLYGALRATSWGAPQIMGFNHADAGFESASAMVRHMAEGAPQQLGAFVQLVEGWGLVGALRARDWTSFARRYNGSGQVDYYARKMEAAYRRHSGGRRSAVVLRVGDRGPAVAELQRALGIADDGAFGPETLRAVQDFQRREGLAVDGVVGALTWQALRAPRVLTEGDSEDRLPPHPPSQGASADTVLERVSAWSAAGGGVTAFAAAVREALPEPAVMVLVGAAALAGVIAVSAWAIRRVRT